MEYYDRFGGQGSGFDADMELLAIQDRAIAAQSAWYDQLAAEYYPKSVPYLVSFQLLDQFQIPLEMGIRHFIEHMQEFVREDTQQKADAAWCEHQAERLDISIDVAHADARRFIEHYQPELEDLLLED